MNVSRSWSRRLLMVAATVTVAAGVPALGIISAAAAPTGDLTLAGPTHGAAGNCLTYTVTPTNAFGGPASDTGTVVVRLTENPANDPQQDVDFCRLSGQSSPDVSPHYVNAASTKQFYVAGSSVTSTPTALRTKTSPTDTGTGADNPDVASPTTPPAQANPTGADTTVFVYDGRQGASTVITFGVSGLVPGGARLDVFRSADGDEVQNNTDLARSLAITFTAGGLPDSTQAADAVSGVGVTPVQSFVPAGSTHTFTAVLTNAAGDVVGGVTPLIAATSGPNAPSTTLPNGTFTGSCTRSGNDGVSTCSYSASKAGSDVVTVFVNQTRARTPSPTLGLDPNEPRGTATATSTGPVGTVRFLDLTPPTDSAVAGASRQFTATTTDANGVPSAGVGLSFSETGPGTLQNGTVGAGGTSTLFATTGASGSVTVTIVTAAGDQGTDTITVTIRNPAATSCQSTGGRCSDSSVLTVGPPAPTPTPTPPAPACATAATGLPATTITATAPATVTVSATAGSAVDLFAYSRPSSTFAIVRSGVVTADGTISWQIRPATNTRLYAQQRGCPAGRQAVLNVRTALSITATRDGVRTYTFRGDSIPARPGGLIVTIYRITADGQQVPTAQVRADAINGQWAVRRHFSGHGRIGFVARTGQDLLNAPGASRVRSLLVY